MTQYIKPLNVIHPFYYPQLATCPRCGSDKETSWEGWTSTGARELHGLICEETALGAQLQCNICKESAKMKKGNTKNTPGDDDAGAQASETADLEGYCFATTSAAYWRTWEHWRIPREFHALDIQNAPRT
jgi:formate dehydrogenase maturation protein FdhE